MIRNRTPSLAHTGLLVKRGEGTSGKRRAISTSKMRKTIATKKKRVENLVLGAIPGSNPHSKGIDISREIFNFSPRAKARATKRKGKESKPLLAQTSTSIKVLFKSKSYVLNVLVGYLPHQ